MSSTATFLNGTFTGTYFHGTLDVLDHESIDPSLMTNLYSPEDDYQLSDRKYRMRRFHQEPVSPLIDGPRSSTLADAFLTARKHSEFLPSTESHGRSVSPSSLHHSSGGSSIAQFEGDLSYESTALPSTPGDLEMSPPADPAGHCFDDSTGQVVHAIASNDPWAPPDYNYFESSHNAGFDHASTGSPFMNSSGLLQSVNARTLDSFEGGPGVHPSNYPDLGDLDIHTTQTEAGLPTLKSQQMTGPTSEKRSSRTSGKNLGRKPSLARTSPVAKTTRRPHARASIGPIAASKPEKPRVSCTTKHTTKTNMSKQSKAEHVRPFTCIFHFAGCDSKFSSKNEWKRHVMSQHLCLTYYLCTHDNCAQGVPDSPIRRSMSLAKNGHAFNRKDLFTQHVRRTHVPPPFRNDKSPEWEGKIRAMQEAARRSRGEMPRHMRCPAPDCGNEFRGENAWNDYMEHIARHLDDRPNERDVPHVAVQFGGPEDSMLTSWAESVDVIKRDRFGQWELSDPLNDRSSRRGAARHGPSRKTKVTSSADLAENDDEDEGY